MTKLQTLLEMLLAEVERSDEERVTVAEQRHPAATGVPAAREKPRSVPQDPRVHQGPRPAAPDALRRFQEAEIRGLIESLPDAVLIGTRDGLSTCNSSALRILGISSLEPIRDHARQIACFNPRWPDGRPLAEAELPIVRALNGESVIEEYLLTRPDTGQDVYLRAAAAPILDNGAIAGAVVIHTDLSELQRQAEQLRLAYERVVTERTQELTRANAALAKALTEVETLKERCEAENAYWQVENDSQYNFGEVIGQSEALKEVFFRIETVAPQDTTVLLLGETGTGKGMVARAIHARSPRKDRPMVMVNCTSLPASLIESELFGREKGAFTGASAQQIGRFELADKSTLFLDEIGDLPLELQAKLLQVLQEKEFCRLGSPRTIKVNVRIIAATNRDLKEQMAQGRFREDLYYRLNIFPVVVPPLRQRRDDIPLLVKHFLAKFGRSMGKDIKHVSAAAMKRLVEHAWPGNVRELENVIERAVITTTGDTLQMLDRFEPSPAEEETCGQTLGDLERGYILKVLRRTRGRIDGQHGAAVILGLNSSTLRGRMRKLGIQPMEWLAE